MTQMIRSISLNPGNNKGATVLIQTVFLLLFSVLCFNSRAQITALNKNTEKAKASSVIGKTIKDFSLLNVDRNRVSLSDYKDAKGFIVIFTCNHCPYAKLYSKRFNELNAKYKPLGFPLLAIN